MEPIEALGKFLEPISIDKAMQYLIQELFFYSPYSMSLKPKAQEYSEQAVKRIMDAAKFKAIHD